ncbi:MAG TPA: HD domain-containing protein [Candidatus Omnitrophota bacterium]|nr:HD domain-containing protein [Candidatus Omnitrophota bacterium]
MNRLKRWLESFRVRVTLTLVFSMLFMGVVSDTMLQHAALQVQFENLRDRLKAAASIVASAIDAEMIRQIPLNRSGVQSPMFRALFERFEKIKQENPWVGFIYILAPKEGGARWQFVVDADPYLSHRKNVTAYPGDEYDVTNFPEIREALKGPVAERIIKSDDWGTMLSGYAPIVDGDGNPVAIVGVDTLVSDIYRMRKKIQEKVLWAILLGTLWALILGFWLSKKLTGSLRGLSRGIRSVSRGDLKYKIDVRGNDEIAELSRDFNRMAEDLNRTHQKNQAYFYGVIRSLVTILEARDPYTRGHSERVAELSANMATQMGLAPDRIEMLKQTAILHDIGKLGIHEAILCKKEKLTERDWELLRTHPALGEDILKPVSLDPEILAAVRGHHERHDGTGYPDRIAGEDIHVFSRILSVADAYDAMTTARSYRQAMKHDEAIAELKKHSGSQFDPKIIDLLIRCLTQGEKPAS